VPKALHIYVWKQFWICYGRGFDFQKTLDKMPESLHVWFMNMFKYAEASATSHIIEDILKYDGIFSAPSMLMSNKGSRFISILAEANSAAVLKILESTLGKWTDKQLLNFSENRQHIVWTLEKIAVWQPFIIRAIQVLSRLAINENAKNFNNSTGTLLGLFRIGVEAAVTESSPKDRLPAMLKLLRSDNDIERRLGLQAMQIALSNHDMGFRIIGPEYQGLKKKAKLWIPATYDDWWQAKFLYFKTLIDETKNWSVSLHLDVCDTLLKAATEQITIPLCTELSFQVLDTLMNDKAMPAEKLNQFFYEWQEYSASKHADIAKRLRQCEYRYTQRNLASRFQRYVLDVDHFEWDENFRKKHNKPKNRAQALLNALARRIAQNPRKLDEIQFLLSPEKHCFVLGYFGEQLAHNDRLHVLLPLLIQVTLKTKHPVCLQGYLNITQTSEPELYRSIVSDFLGSPA
jgi:hypothetical protein